MDISMNNIKNVLLIIISLVGLLGFAYLMFIFQGLIVGTTTNVATSGDINVSSAMQSHLSEMETNYINAADSLESKIKLGLSIFAIVILLVLFGVKAYGAYKNRGGF